VTVPCSPKWCRGSGLAPAAGGSGPWAGGCGIGQVEQVFRLFVAGLGFGVRVVGVVAHTRGRDGDGVGAADSGVGGAAVE
jgi:hypothetical protein